MTAFYQVINYVYKTNENHLIEVLPSKYVYTNIEDAELAMREHIDTLCGLGYERTDRENKIYIERVEKGKNVIFIEEFKIKELTIIRGQNVQK